MAAGWTLNSSLTALLSVFTQTLSFLHAIASQTTICVRDALHKGVFWGGGGCCGGNLCSSSFLVHSSSLWLHQSHPIITVIHLFLPHPSFIAQLLFRMPLCGRGLEAACLHFRLLRTSFSPLTDMLKSVFVPVLYSGEVWKLPARWYER